MLGATRQSKDRDKCYRKAANIATNFSGGFTPTYPTTTDTDHRHHKSFMWIPLRISMLDLIYTEAGLKVGE